MTHTPLTNEGRLQIPRLAELETLRDFMRSRALPYRALVHDRDGLVVTVASAYGFARWREELTNVTGVTTGKLVGSVTTVHSFTGEMDLTRVRVTVKMVGPQAVAS